jgi:enoyl-CoA hydratase
MRGARVVAGVAAIAASNTGDECMSEVVYERRGDIALLTLNRPEVLNSISNGMLGALEDLLQQLDADDSRAVILTGTGRAFCAGTDLKEWHGDPAERLLRVHALICRMRDLSKPLIAAINGMALGGGLELALGCTFRVARESAKLGLPEVKLGLLPAYCGTQLLPRLIGESRALQMMLSGDPVDGIRAERIGLVDSLCGDDQDVVDAALSFAAAFTRHSLVPQRAIRRAVREGLTLPLEQALQLERALVGEVSASADTLEGVNAFLEKRAPRWQDC